MKQLKLYGHQKQTVNFLDKNRRAFIASTAGVGKSATIVTDITRRLNSNPMSKSLILAPKSLLDTVWKNEFALWSPHVIVSVATAPTKKRLEAFEKPANVYITNIDALKWLSQQPPKFWDNFETVVIDESTSIANDSARTKAAMKIKKYFKYRRCLSGTPTSGLLTQLFYQYLFLDDGAHLGVSWYKFRNQVLIGKQTGPSPNMLTWENKPGKEAVLAHLLKDITIRHVLDEVIDMPSQVFYTYRYSANNKVARAYTELKNSLRVQLKTGTVNAVNASALTQKLSQVACLTGDTEILTSEGWKEIQNLNNTEQLWDGNKWVNYDKLLDKGYRYVLNCWGVEMTPDHKLLTTKGWKEARDINNAIPSKRFSRASFQLPNSNRPGTFNNTREENAKILSGMEMPMPLRERSSKSRSVFKKLAQKIKKLWLYDGKMEHNSRTYRYTSFIQQMVKNKIQMFKSTRQGLSQLRRSWYNIGCTMARLQPVFIGHGELFQGRNNFRQTQYKQRIQQSKLQMGRHESSAKQQTQQPHYKYTQRKNERYTSFKSNECALKTIAKQSICRMGSAGQRLIQTLETSNKIKRVYDILNAGKKHQFLIRNKNKEAFISHNSGFILDTETQKSHLVDFQRYELVLDLCEQYKHAVVFFRWTAQREYFMEIAEKRGLNATFIDGSVSQKHRNSRVSEFQNGEYDIIFLQPQSSAHGITLTTGNCTIWACPTYLSDYYSQGNNRVYRAGQTKRTTVINVECTGTIDKLIYDRLNGKLESMSLLQDAL